MLIVIQHVRGLGIEVAARVPRLHCSIVVDHEPPTARPSFPARAPGGAAPLEPSPFSKLIRFVACLCIAHPAFGGRSVHALAAAVAPEMMYYLRRLLHWQAYKFHKGPWRLLLIRRGVDPRASSALRHLQLVYWRQPQQWCGHRTMPGPPPPARAWVVGVQRSRHKRLSRNPASIHLTDFSSRTCQPQIFL